MIIITIITIITNTTIIIVMIRSTTATTSPTTTEAASRRGPTHKDWSTSPEGDRSKQGRLTARLSQAHICLAGTQTP